MRLVRFYLEPWQKGGSVTSASTLHTPSLASVSPSPNPLLITAVINLPVPLSVQRRQRSIDLDNNSETDVDKLSKEAREKRLHNRLKYRYPKMVKRLSSICGDVIAKNVDLSFFLNIYKCIPTERPTDRLTKPSNQPIDFIFILKISLFSVFFFYKRHKHLRWPQARVHCVPVRIWVQAALKI